MTDLIERITEYLSKGGLFNPELMDAQAVRDLLLDCRSQLTASRAECEGLRAALETLCNAVMTDIKEAKLRLDAYIAKDAPVHPVSAFLTGMAIHVGKARAALSQKDTSDAA